MLGSDKEHQANSQHQAKLDILVGYFSHVIKNLQDFNPIRVKGAWISPQTSISPWKKGSGKPKFRDFA